MATFSPMNSLNGPRDHLDRLVADILDDADECPVEVSDVQEDLVKPHAAQKEEHHGKGKEVSYTLQNCFLTNGRSSSGSSSNGDSRDSGFEGGIGSGNVSTPSSSRRTTTSSDNFSTPSGMSTTSEGFSPSSSSDKMVSNNFDATSELNLQMSPWIVQGEIGPNSPKSATLINSELDNLFNAELHNQPSIGNADNLNIYINRENSPAGKFNTG